MSFPCDIIFLAKSPTALQRELDIQKNMAYRERNDLDTRKGKSEVLESEETSAQTFVLAGKPLFQVAEAANLVISLGLSGTMDKNTIKRITSANEATHQLKSLEESAKGIYNLKAKRIYEAVIQSG